MKQLILVVFLLIGMVHTQAQSFGGKGHSQFTIGLGLTQQRTVFPENGKGPKGATNTFYGQLSFQFELGISKYVGLGLCVGGTYANNLSQHYGTLTGLYGVNFNSAFRSLGIPVAVFGNFHFLQLISDKSGKSIADKMDVYAGLSLGSGPAFALPKKDYKSYGNDVGYLIYGGPHVGIRYYPKSSFGFYAEVGYGKSLVNLGMSLKF